MECCICLDSSNTLGIRCTCGYNICIECMESYLNFCLNEYQTLPKCANSKCNLEFYYKQIPKNFLEIYNQLVFNYLKRTPDLEIKINNRELITRLIIQKRNLIEEIFPKSIGLIAEIAFSKKMKKVKIPNTKNNSKKKCFNMFCNRGFLNEKLECNTCFEKFCPDCEQILSIDHICTQEDIETVNYLKTIVKCPNCDTKIIKSDGCDHMTCSVCKTKFEYLNGQIGGHGSHNPEIKLKDVNSYKLSERLRGKYSNEIVEKIIEIENSPPEKFIFPEFDHPSKILSKLYYKYRKNQNKIKNYFNKLRLIETAVSKNELTIDML